MLPWVVVSVCLVPVYVHHGVHYRGGSFIFPQFDLLRKLRDINILNSRKKILHAISLSLLLLPGHECRRKQGAVPTLVSSKA